MRSRARPLVVVLVAILVVSAIRWALTRRPAPTPVRPADLVAWDLTGCWEIDVEAWSAGADGALPGAESPEARLLSPPGRLRLLADSIDPSRRPSTTYRATPMDSVDEALLHGLRWFVRADTLWIIWANQEARAGIALIRADRRLEGIARGLAEGVDVQARAAAWQIDCATGLTKRLRTGPRR